MSSQPDPVLPGLPQTINRKELSIIEPNHEGNFVIPVVTVLTVDPPPSDISGVLFRMGAGPDCPVEVDISTLITTEVDGSNTIHICTIDPAALELVYGTYFLQLRSVVGEQVFRSAHTLRYAQDFQGYLPGVDSQDAGSFEALREYSEQ